MEKYYLTDEGVQEAIEILERGGFLPEVSDDEIMNTVQLKVACEQYITVSREKGDKRTDQECQDAMVVVLLEARLKDAMRRIVN
jgi:hypothetical protein